MPRKKLKLIDVLGGYSPKLLSNGQIRMECPFRDNHSSGDGKMSFFLSPDKNCYHCFSCGAKGTVVRLLTTKFKVDYFSAVEMVNLTDYSRTDHEDFDLDITWSITPPEDFISRGFTHETLRHFRFGSSDGWIIIPFYRDFNHPMELIGYQKRKNIPDRLVLNSKGFKKKTYLYNLDTSYEYVVVVEGYSDVMRLYQHGYNAVALLGADMSKWQAGQLSKFKRVYLALDNDIPGRRATEICYYLLKDSTSVLLVPYQTKDPGECKKKSEWVKSFKESSDYIEYSIEMTMGWDGYLAMREEVIRELKHRES